MRANTTFLEPVINAHIAKLDVIPYAKAIRLVLPNSRRYIKCVWHNVMNMQTVKEATGIDMADIVRANSINAKTDRNINIHGLPVIEKADDNAHIEPDKNASDIK